MTTVAAAHAAPTTSPLAERAGPAAILLAPDAARLQLLDCASGRETGSFALAAPAAHESIALAPEGDAAFVATVDRQLLRLSIPQLEPQARAGLAVDAHALAASGGADATVLAGGSGGSPLSAHDAVSLAAAHEYRLDDGRHATVSAIVDRPQRARFVVAFSDLDEVWEIAYGRSAEPVLKGLVHDYRMREAIELPGRYTPRPFRVPGATRALVPGAVSHEVLRIDASGALGVVDLNVRREIERPAATGIPAPERIAGWRGERSRGWVLADEGASTLRVLDARSWKFAEPMPVGGEILAIVALDDGAVLLALDRNTRIVLARVDVATRRMHEFSTTERAGQQPWRLVRGTGGCIALVDARNRWLAGVTRETRAAAPGRGS